MLRQKTFFINCGDPYNSNEYIKSSSNELVYQSIIDWKKSWGILPYKNTLIIHGSKSSGKTFIANTWAKDSCAFFIDKRLTIREETLTKYDAFIIDDIDKFDEEEALHHFNTIYQHRKYLLVTLSGISNFNLPDLASRIRSTQILKLNKPDDELIKQLIFKMFSHYSVIVGHEVLNYMIKILPREFDSIVSTVERINKQAILHKRKITIPFVKEVITQYASHT